MSEPLLQLLDPAGQTVGALPDVPREDLRRLFRHILKMRVLDQRMLSRPDRDGGNQRIAPNRG